MWVNERATKIQKSSRPESLRPEAWIRFSKKQKEIFIILSRMQCQTASSTPHEKILRRHIEDLGGSSFERKACTKQLGLLNILCGESERAARLFLLCASLEVFATPTRRYHGRMLIHPSLPACATHGPEVFAHTQVRDPRGPAAAC